MIELEKKLPLTKEEYEYLLENLGKNKPHIKQTNYYFDTEDLSMNSQDITCRIRFKDGKYKGTIKRHTKAANQSVETEVKVKNGIYDNALIDMGLMLHGALVTERCTLFKNEACEVVLDKNSYLDYYDYELEIEYHPQKEQTANVALRVIMELLLYKYPFLTAKNLCARLKNAPSKSKRFFDKKHLKIKEKKQ